ncbi:MAG: type II secretion system F family protein [Elusimicrobia bacterium]|nr:type II secretion system F family protein [Elusimicrobiota bacterium]
MNPGTIILYIVSIAGGVAYMAFQSRCFKPLCLLTYICMAAGMLAVYSFAEALIGAFGPKKDAPGLDFAAGRHHQEAGGEQEFAAAGPADTSFLSRINKTILANPWITQFLERDYYGLAQRKDMEPRTMLVRMEKYGAVGAVGLTVATMALGLRFNPGLSMVGFVGGFFLPHLNARKAIGLRHRKALMNLPSFVDLLALTIESGLDYLSSMEKILATTFKNKGALEEEIDNVMRQIQLGFPRRDALRNMAKRVDVQEIRSLVGLLIQSDELGTGLVQLLRNFSQDMRNRRTGRAEEMAGKASTKMLGPMMIFIFPVIFALILAPFAMSLIKGGGMSF